MMIHFSVLPAWSLLWAVGDSVRSSAENGDLSAFLQEATLSWREQNKEKDKSAQDAVKIITIHSAKGLGIPECLYCRGGGGDYSRTGIQKRKVRLKKSGRLFYVAITRARLELVITRCLNRLQRGKPSPRDPSRFLGEIPAELLEKETPAAFDPAEREDILAAIHAAMNN